jgi:hypothetical protein
MVKRWRLLSSMPARPTSGNVAGVSGLTGNPVVIWPNKAAWALHGRHAQRAAGFRKDRQHAEVKGVEIE